MHPDTMFQIAKAYHAEALRDAEAYHLARQAQGEQPNLAKQMMNHVIAFAQRVGAKRLKPAQTGEMVTIKLSREQS
ncbi:MAG: hypothetical protein GC204_01265 [Chloroflexi bacterium]|nr:hypothetical protein [Chloroflexota bacterium]